MPEVRVVGTPHLVFYPGNGTVWSRNSPMVYLGLINHGPKLPIAQSIAREWIQLIDWQKRELRRPRKGG